MDTGPDDTKTPAPGPSAEPSDAPTPADTPADPATRRVRRKRRYGHRRRRAMVVGGTSLVLVGVLVLGWVGWQFWGTNWVSERRQVDVVAALESGWGDGASESATEFGTAKAILRIPRFGESYAIPILEGSGDDVLAAGVGHMEDTAEVGEVGNYALAAHRVTHGEPFADFPDLRPGDLVYVDTREATYTYELDTGGLDLIVPFTADWVLETFPDNPDSGGTQPPPDVGRKLLTLLTCSEIFHTDNRSVAFGHLVDTVPSGI